MRPLFCALLMIALAPISTALANSCYVREYPAAHLQAHPDQTVRLIRAYFVTDGDLLVFLRVNFRDQDRNYDTQLTCEEPSWDRNGLEFCAGRNGAPPTPHIGAVANHF